LAAVARNDPAPYRLKVRRSLVSKSPANTGTSCFSLLPSNLAQSTLRGRAKANIQWKFYCPVHNFETIARYGAMNN